MSQKPSLLVKIRRQSGIEIGLAARVEGVICPADGEEMTPDTGVRFVHVTDHTGSHETYDLLNGVVGVYVEFEKATVQAFRGASPA